MESLTNVEVHIQHPNPSRISTGQLGSGVSAAGTSRRPNSPSLEGIVAPQVTLSNDHPHQKAGAVLLKGPWPLQSLRPFHMSVPRDQAIHAPNPLPSRSRVTFTPTGAVFAPSTMSSVQASGAATKSSTASRSGLASSSAYTNGFRVVRPSDTVPGHNLASDRNISTTPAWPPLNPIPSLGSASFAARTTNTGFTISGGKNASASFKYMAAASGTEESSSLKEYLDSIKNETGNVIKLPPGLAPRPNDVRPHTWNSSRLLTGLHATNGGHNRTTGFNNKVMSNIFNLTDLGGECSTLENSLKSMNKSVTADSKSGRLEASGSSGALQLLGMTGSQAGNSGARYPMNCSGLATSTAHVLYETLTFTITVNETMTLGPNATTPLPVFHTPPPACQTSTAICEGKNCPSSSALGCGIPKQPGVVSRTKQPTLTSTLLVTKKSPAIMQQLSAVGNLFGASTTSTQAVVAQQNSDGQQNAGQNPGSSNSDMSTQSDDSIPSDSNSDGNSDTSTSKQNPANDESPSAPSNSQKSDSQNADTGSSGGKSTGSDQSASNGEQSNRPASNSGATSGNKANSNHGDASGKGDASSGSMNAGGGASSNGQVTKNSGTANPESGSGDGDISSSGNPDAGGATSSEGGGALNKGGALSNEGSVANAGGVSSNGAVSNTGIDSSNEGSSKLEAGSKSSANSKGAMYVPSIVMAGNIPISIASNAVIVGSHTVPVGSPPTSVVANGQTIAILPSQIVAQGKTIPIQVTTSPPARSATIGDVPVVLRHQDVEIGSQTFEHGSSPTFIEYHGQTYSWDASHLVAAGTTVVFPSVDSSVPRVTAGGQVFSVFASHLKASGRSILLPNTAKPSPFVLKGQTFSVNPSQIIAPKTSITLPSANKVTPFVYIDHSLSVDASQFMARSTTIPLISGSGIVTYNAQVLTIKPSEIIGPGTTIALSAPDDSGVTPTAVTTEGLTFSVGPSAAVVGDSTYSFVPGKSPATIVTNGEAVLVGSNGIQFGRVHVPVPTSTPSFSAITQGDLTFSVAPSEVVVGGHTEPIHSAMTPITTVVDGHIISIGPKGVGLARTTIPLPTPKPSYSMATEGDLTFSVAHSEVVVKGETYELASNKAPTTTTIDGQTITIGFRGIQLEGTTVNLPAIRTPISVTAGGLTFSVGATDAVISGTTYSIGSGARLQTVVVGSQTIQVGSGGVMLPSTTIAPEQTPVAVTAEGLTFSMDSTEAVFNGTTYAIGKGAMAKTIVEGSVTMILGSYGVALPLTTIKPGLSAAQPSFSSVLGTSDILSAGTTNRVLTPIATGKEGDIKHAAGSSIKVPSSSTLLGLALVILILGLYLI